MPEAKSGNSDKTVVPTEPESFTPVTETDKEGNVTGRWTFKSWDKTSVTINKANETVTGTWVYEPVVTRFVDESGKEIDTQVTGRHEQHPITGYTFVRTTVDESCNVTHVYKTVETSVKPVVKNMPNTGAHTSGLLAGSLVTVILGAVLILAQRQRS